MSAIALKEIQELTEAQAAQVPPIREECKINTVEKLVATINAIFAKGLPYERIHDCLTHTLQRVDLTQNETNKYTFFDLEKPYTRNLVASDGKHYSLLILCWGPGKGSKIHNHPCDGCYIRSLSGCIKETRYDVLPGSDEIKQSAVKFYCEGQVSYMTDNLGLHKITNPNANVGAVTLHLYTPPFQSCKVWSHEGQGELSKSEIGLVGFFSVCGLRTPNLEGKPGVYAKLMNDIQRRRPLTESDLILRTEERARGISFETKGEEGLICGKLGELE